MLELFLGLSHWSQYYRFHWELLIIEFMHFLHCPFLLKEVFIFKHVAELSLPINIEIPIRIVIGWDILSSKVLQIILHQDVIKVLSIELAVHSLLLLLFLGNFGFLKLFGLLLSEVLLRIRDFHFLQWECLDIEFKTDMKSLNVLVKGTFVEERFGTFGDWAKVFLTLVFSNMDLLVLLKVG